MKQFIMNPGGLPYTQDDLVWIQNALIEALGAASTIQGTNTYFIVPPIFTTGATTTYTAGIVMVNGVIYLIDANNVGIPAVNTHPYIYLEPVVTYDPAGSKVFADSTTKDTYEITKMKVMSYAAAQVTTNPLYTAVPLYSDLLGAVIEGRRNKFTKIQSLAIGTSQVISGGAVTIPSDGNTLDVSIASNDVLSIISNPMPAGTRVTLRFVGNAATDIVTVESGAGLQTAGDMDYLFRSGQSATFVSLDSNSSIWRLETPATSAWKVLTTGDLSNGWGVTRQLRYRVLAGAKVEFEGTITPGSSNILFVMPAALKPKRDTILLNVAAVSGPDIIGAYIEANSASGAVTANDMNGGLTAVGYTLNGFGYYIV